MCPFPSDLSFLICTTRDQGTSPDIRGSGYALPPGPKTTSAPQKRVQSQPPAPSQVHNSVLTGVPHRLTR